jgi:hypothetical protein
VEAVAALVVAAAVEAVVAEVEVVAVVADDKTASDPCPPPHVIRQMSWRFPERES